MLVDLELLPLQIYHRRISFDERGAKIRYKQYGRLHGCRVAKRKYRVPSATF